MDGAPLLFVCSVVIAVLALHWNVTKTDAPCGITDLFQAAFTWGKMEFTPSRLAGRVEKELLRVRMATFMVFLRLCMHLVMMVMLMSILEFAQQPSYCSGIWLFCMCLIYLADYALVTGFVSLTPFILRSMRISLCAVSLSAAAANGSASKDDFLGRFGILLGSQTLQAILFPAGTLTVAHSACHTVLYIWSTTQVYGHVALNFWLLIFHMSFQVLVCVTVPFLLDFAIRECIVASFQSQDSDSLISGFRQMLKGICDGELLLDGDFRISGGAPCLQRLLGGTDDFAGCCFRDLIDGDDARTKFDRFMQPEKEGEEGEESARCTRGAPRCLRTPLKAQNQSVAVDVYHVRLPPSLYGESTTYHLIAIAEDADSRAHPEANLQAQEALSRSLLASRRAPPVESAASSETQVEAYEELEEMTLLVNTGTELLDIEEAHLRFVRRTDEAEVRMGMPTLKRFARPLDWGSIDGMLRSYARHVRKAHARGEVSQLRKRQSLPPLHFRVPGEPRKHVFSRSVTVSSPFEREETVERVFLYVHLMDFGVPPQSTASSYLEGLYQEQLQPPVPPPPAHEESEEPQSPPSAELGELRHRSRPRPTEAPQDSAPAALP